MSKDHRELQIIEDRIELEDGRYLIYYSFETDELGEIELSGSGTDKDV